MQLENGEVLVWELPSDVNENMVRELEYALRTSLRPGHFQTAGSISLYTTTGVNEPDNSFRPVGRPPPTAATLCSYRGGAYPTMVCEVGVRESMNHVHAKAARWFSARITIRVYLAFKILFLVEASKKLVSQIYHELVASCAQTMERLHSSH